LGSKRHSGRSEKGPGPGDGEGRKTHKVEVDQLGNICEYRSPAEVRKLREEEYKKIYEMAVKIGLRKN